MTRKFMLDAETEGGAGDAVVEKGTYTARVEDARALEDRDFLWIDLRILGGPDDGTVVSVSLNMPKDSDSRGARWYFLKKVGGFLPYAKQVWTMPDEEQPAALAQAITGKTVEVVLSIQADGQYKGSQQLDETRQIVDVTPPQVVTTDTVSTNAAAVEANAVVEPGIDPPF